MKERVCRRQRPWARMPSDSFPSCCISPFQYCTASCFTCLFLLVHLTLFDVVAVDQQRQESIPYQHHCSIPLNHSCAVHYWIHRSMSHWRCCRLQTVHFSSSHSLASYHGVHPWETAESWFFAGVSYAGTLKENGMVSWFC
jgi:hypothetical protein